MYYDLFLRVLEKELLQTHSHNQQSIVYVESGQVTGATSRETERIETGDKTGDKEKVEKDT